MARKFLGGLLTKSADATDPAPPAKANARYAGGGTFLGSISWGTPYRGEWSTQRGLNDGMLRSIWTYKAIDTIAKDIARLPINLYKGDYRVNDLLSSSDAPLLWNRLNIKANPFEFATTMRWRMVHQLLMSKRGIFAEFGRKGDEVDWMYLLNPDTTAPVPHREKFVSGYEVVVDGAPDPKWLDPDSVLWIRIPHPMDPYASLTPLEAAGLSIDIDYYSRLYNRNFLVNDGRPAGLLTIGGGMSEDDVAILNQRFGGRAEPGRITVIEADDANFEDLSTTPRDAAYSQLRPAVRDEVLGAFGVPRSRTGDASGITQDQAEVEEFIYWNVTVLPLIDILNLYYGSLTPGGDNDDIWVRHDTSGIRALQRPIREDQQRAIERYRDGLSTLDETRDALDQEPANVPGSKTFFIPAGKVAIPASDEDAAGVAALQTVPSATPPGAEPGDDETPRLPGSPGAPRIAALLSGARGDNLRGGMSPEARAALPAPVPLGPGSSGQTTSRETDEAWAADEASRVQQRRDAERVSKDAGEMETKADGHDFDMLALALPHSLAAPLFRGSPVPTLDPSTAHITLALTDVKGAMGVVEEWARRTAPIAVTVGPDLETFPEGDDGVPVFYPVRSATLAEARKDLRDSLATAGFEVKEHPTYTPHVTVAYAETTPASLEPSSPQVVNHVAEAVHVEFDDGSTTSIIFGGGDGAAQ